MCRRLNPWLSFTPLGWLHIQNKVNGCQQEVRPVCLGYERIYGLQSIVGQFHVVSEHDDGKVRPDLLDLSRYD